jgi:hypothetical protein
MACVFEAGSERPAMIAQLTTANRTPVTPEDSTTTRPDPHFDLHPIHPSSLILHP